ncbi:MAG TPA: serine/threonine-protein kinase [Polyangiaceae bacterium]|nr:serine/threonine-protein kinase [Polyangiaceae bacterium]HNZ22185.1 serine/threonine-protein kinase [Polyangiaceae bacterium]HOD23972.1 serine/threonine-protein kinase [Polyangiaceae bacterium]HOE47009.1 serine/threonine-protein kinase [Polyangiaceae bacterium]HOG99854.1 serine/threonine-protein kinase [Polyangiaceae bacterium]
MTTDVEGVKKQEMARPRRLGKFRFIAEIGHGGMAEVFLAVMEGPARFSKLIALKILREQFAEQPEGREMFLNEARLAARLSHPNVVSVQEVGEEDGRLFIAMEYLQGQPMSRLMSRIRKSEEELVPLPVLLRILSEALAGLAHAHECTDYDGTPLQLVHRDVTPHNIFVTYDGTVKMLDFGIAKAVSVSTQTRAGTIKGKVSFLAPEQLLGEASLDLRVDIYALGCCLWEALAKQRPYQGMSDVAVMTRVASVGAPPIREAVPHIHPELERICMKAIAFRPEDRYQDALEFQSDLDQFILSLGQPIGRKEISAHMMRVFAEDRAKARALIEANLSAASLTSTDEFSVASLATASGSWPDSSSSSRSGMDRNVEFSVPTELPAARKTKMWAVVVGVGGLLLVGALVIGLNSGDAATDTPPVTASASAEQPVGTIHLQVSAQPSLARMFLDGKTLATNPMELTVPKDGEKHVIRAEAPGYVGKAEQIRFDRDQVIQFELEKHELPADTSAASTTAPPAKVGPVVGPHPRGPKPTAEPAEPTTATPPPVPTPDPSKGKTKRKLDDDNPFE